MLFSTRVSSMRRVLARFQKVRLRNEGLFFRCTPHAVLLMAASRDGACQLTWPLEVAHVEQAGDVSIPLFALEQVLHPLHDDDIVTIHSEGEKLPCSVSVLPSQTASQPMQIAQWQGTSPFALPQVGTKEEQYACLSCQRTKGTFQRERYVPFAEISLPRQSLTQMLKHVGWAVRTPQQDAHAVHPKPVFTTLWMEMHEGIVIWTACNSFQLAQEQFTMLDRSLTWPLPMFLPVTWVRRVLPLFARQETLRLEPLWLEKRLVALDDQPVADAPLTQHPVALRLTGMDCGGEVLLRLHEETLPPYYHWIPSRWTTRMTCQRQALLDALVAARTQIQEEVERGKDEHARVLITVAQVQAAELLLRVESYPVSSPKHQKDQSEEQQQTPRLLATYRLPAVVEGPAMHVPIEASLLCTALRASRVSRIHLDLRTPYRPIVLRPVLAQNSQESALWMTGAFHVPQYPYQVSAQTAPTTVQEEGAYDTQEGATDGKTADAV